MEEVIPGVEADHWDSDPVAYAAELRRAGDAQPNLPPGLAAEIAELYR